MEGLAKFFLQNRALSWLLLVLILGGGIFSYYNMGKLEDAPFTIKQAVVTTSYPGASPMEVQQQVTDVLEEAIQSLGELYYLKTDNRAGLSKITVYVKRKSVPTRCSSFGISCGGKWEMCSPSCPLEPDRRW